MHSNVEFRVVGRPTFPNDRAVEISMRDGIPITYETKITGGKRRTLATRYNRSDIKAQLPRELNFENRKSGFVCEYDTRKLYGYICPYDNLFSRIFFHIDECHIKGNRQIRINQEVEFNVILKDRAESRAAFDKALHITGPDSTILQWNQDNDTLGASSRTRKLPISADRFRGIIRQVNNENKNLNDFWGFICPDNLGFQEIYFHKGQIIGAFNKFVERGTIVEFGVEETKEGKLRAKQITRPGFKPLVYYKGTIGEFYRGHNLALHECEAVPMQIVK
eukprot:UN28985